MENNSPLLSRRDFLKGAVGALGLAAIDGLTGGKLREVQAQEPEPVIAPENVIDVVNRLTGLPYRDLPGTTTDHRYGFQVNIPELEVQRLTAAGHPNPNTAIGIVNPAGIFEVVNPNGLEEGVEGTDTDTARGAALKFSPDASAIAADMTADYAVDNTPYDVRSQDSTGFWLIGKGETEIVMVRNTGDMLVIKGNIDDRAFGTGSTISFVKSDLTVVESQDIAGVPTSIQMTAFEFDSSTGEFTIPNSLDKVFVNMKVIESDFIQIQVGGPTSFVDSDGAGTADFQDAGIAALGEADGSTRLGGTMTDGTTRVLRGN